MSVVRRGARVARRFCLDCGLPLVREGATEEPPRSALAEPPARSPTYAEGPLVRAAWARNQAEAELIQGLLLEEGIPSLARRSAGSTSRTSSPPARAT